MKSDLAELERGWNEAAATDAYFSILSEPDKRNGKWDPDEFYARGRTDIAEALEGLDIPRDRALDFGCGAGRCTIALADHFTHIHGVDISPAMVRLAKERDDLCRCHFHVNNSADLRLFASKTFDFIYSNITLQHMSRDLMQCYVREFIRTLREDGLALFEIPEGPDKLEVLCSWLSVDSAPRDKVERWITEAGGELVSAEEADWPGGSHVPVWYTARRKPLA